MTVLSLPTIIGTAMLAAVIALVVRTWELPAFWNYVLYGVVCPIVGLAVVTLGPIPCAVFAWHRAADRVVRPRECFAECSARLTRLTRLTGRLLACYLCWFLFFGIPMLFFWPRTCLSPLVVLFENERRVFVRCRRLLKEENTVYILAGLYTLLCITLGLLIAVPRLALLAPIFQSPWTRAVKEYLWAFEFLSGTILISGMAVSWCLALTFLYRDIRRIREGEELREKLKSLRDKLQAVGAG